MERQKHIHTPHTTHIERERERERLSDMRPTSQHRIIHITTKKKNIPQVKVMSRKTQVHFMYQNFNKAHKKNPT